MFILKKKYIDGKRSLKEVEEMVIKDIVENKIHFMKWILPTAVSVDTHYLSWNLKIKVRIDKAGIGGSFLFLWIDGVNLSFKTCKEFDYNRVIDTIINKKDPGLTKSKSSGFYRC